MVLSLLCAAAALASYPSAHSGIAEDRPAPELVTVALDHGGDLALRDKLLRAFSIWHDAGEFLVGEIPAARIAGLTGRGIGVELLGAIGTDEELFAVDLAHPEAVAELGAARFLYAGERVAIAAVREFPEDQEHAIGRRHTCHSGHAWFARKGVRPAPPLCHQNVPWTSGNQALGSADPRIQALVNQVVIANLQSGVNGLAAITPNRDSAVAANIDQGRNYIAGRLTSFGYAQPAFQQFSTQHGDNVILEIPGTVNPSKKVVLGGHYDSRNYNGGTSAVAPGADDNASGSSALIEIARILRNAGPFENTIRIIWFAGEEYGLLGSDFNAQQSQSQGEQIIAMLCTDMNAYRQNGDARDVDFTTNSTSASLTAFCRQISPLYVPSWADQAGTLSGGSSDHASYNSHGFPAAFFFEDLSAYSPFIHTSSDNVALSCTDFDLSKMITQGVLACAATLAEPVDLSITHSELPDTQDATGPYTVAAQVTSLIATNVVSSTVWYSIDAGQNWSSLAMSSSGGGNWSAAIGSQGSPVTIRYYIEATDDQGNREVLPDGADLGGTTFDFFVGTKVTFYATSFEEATDNGWTHAQVATQDDWQRGTPNGESTDPSSAFSGTRVWGNDLGAGSFNGAYTDNVNNWLRSPALDCSGHANVTLEFQRWLGVESGQFDDAQVKVNGTIVWSNPASTDLIDSSWVPMSLDISALAAGNPSVQIEFRMISDGGVTFGGWTLDDFQLVELGPGGGGCPQPTIYCTAKVNSQFCLPQIASAGQASASSPTSFDITCTEVINKKFGLLFYGTNGAFGAPFQGGFLCVKAPTTRTNTQNSNGSATGSDCTGTFAYDFNARIQGGQDPDLVIGEIVNAQYWYRDPNDPAGFTTGLSDAIEFEICP